MAVNRFSRVAKVTLNLTLFSLWIWLYWPVFKYLNVLFARQEFRTNLIVLLAVIGLLIYQARKAHFRVQLGSTPHLFLPGLILALGGALAYLSVERFLNINTLSALLFGLATYGLLGLWMAPQRWQQGFPAMLLVAGILPFGEHLETFAGYPLRIFTASLVRDGLAASGFHALGMNTILVFESGISQIDIPCSGVKSLWTGGMFLLAATWIENRPLSLRWLLVAAITVVLLFIANLLRVAILALTGPALGWTLLARMLHVPLGVLGFVAVCAVTLALLRLLPGWPQEEMTDLTTGKVRDLRRPVWLGPGLVACVLIMVFAYTPRAVGQAVSSSTTLTWNFPEGLVVQPAPLTTQELEWIRQGGAETADRYAFQWKETGDQQVSGALMFLTSRTWRGQHQPERCFEVFGLSTQESYTLMPAPDFTLRFLTLSGTSAPGGVSAAYWLQSNSQSTADFGERIWADLGPRRERWVLVTILFDRQVDPNMPVFTTFVEAIRNSVDRSLKEGEMP